MTLPRITYTERDLVVVDDQPVSSVIDIQIERPLNGFPGGMLRVDFSPQNEDRALYIRQRVAWKVSQEIGLRVDESNVFAAV